jgi:hypothetical protein
MTPYELEELLQTANFAGLVLNLAVHLIDTVHTEDGMAYAQVAIVAKKLTRNRSDRYQAFERVAKIYSEAELWREMVDFSECYYGKVKV